MSEIDGDCTECAPYGRAISDVADKMCRNRMGRQGIVWSGKDVDWSGAAWSKWSGSEWRGGIAMWYVTRLDDAWGKYPVPDFLFDSLPMIYPLTWTTPVLEALLPIGLWVPRTRWLTLVVAVFFHLSLECTR